MMLDKSVQDGRSSGGVGAHSLARQRVRGETE
jgi:hypothetical protein